MEKAMSKFRDQIAGVINEHSRENGSDTPDFLLAEYLDACLVAFDAAVNAREKWYSRPGAIGIDSSAASGKVQP